jgi:hypothetical protein
LMQCTCKIIQVKLFIMWFEKRKRENEEDMRKGYNRVCVTTIVKDSTLSSLTPCTAVVVSLLPLCWAVRTQTLPSTACLWDTPEAKALTRG